MKQTSTRQRLKIAGMIIALAVIAIAVVWSILRGYAANWTGFGDFTAPDGDFVRGKTFWDWMELLIIPLALLVGAFFLNQSERAVEREIAENRAKLERDIATDRQHEAALVSYLDRMADSLLKEKIRTSKNKEIRNVARTRTLTVLRGLDTKRKGMVLLFLFESGLIMDKSVVDLAGADLSEADLNGANLREANLRRANLRGADLTAADLNKADLSGAYLGGAKLTMADLGGAILSDAFLPNTNLDRAILRGANLTQATLREATLNMVDLEGAILNITYLGGANLRTAHLSGAILSKAYLSRADLSRADLSRADLSGADLSGADLSDADLSDAIVSDEQLVTVKSLKGATMPDGTKHD